MSEHSDQKLRVLHLSTHHEECGVAKYQENYLAYMADPSIHNEFYETSLNVIKKLEGKALEAELSKLQDQLSQFDILHIQHEFSLFAGDGEGFAKLMKVGRQSGRKVVVTIHTGPEHVMKETRLFGHTPKHFASAFFRRYKNAQIKRRRLEPMKHADLVIAHNQFTKQQLLNLVGVKESRLRLIFNPVGEISPEGKNDSLRNQLNASKEDTILCTVGFITSHKGTKEAVRSLSFLPESYKLAIIGGINPDSGRPVVYDDICDLITERGLQNRVHITGYVYDDDELSRLIRGADIALYPYDVKYYKYVSSGSINMAMQNNVPVIAYPTESFKEINQDTESAIVITESPNYYELGREIQRIDTQKQVKNGKAFAEKNSFTNASQKVAALYHEVAGL